MITIILFALLGLVVAVEYVWYGRPILLNIFATMCLICVGAFIGLLVAFILPMKTKTVMESYKIVSLQDNNSSEGNFFLGSGYMDGKIKYAFYYQKDDGYKLKTVDSENTTIRYSDNIKCERYKQAEVKSFINYFAIDDLSSESNSEYIIYVPKGTIKENYSLDAQ